MTQPATEQTGQSPAFVDPDTSASAPALPPRPPFSTPDSVLGAEVEVSSSGLTGIVVGISYYPNGLLRGDVELPAYIDEQTGGQKLPDALSVDVVQMKILVKNEDRDPADRLNILPPDNTHVYPGDKVKDLLTGQVGYVRSISRAMSGCMYATVQALNPANLNKPEVDLVNCEYLEVLQYDMLGVYAKGEKKRAEYEALSQVESEAHAAARAQAEESARQTSAATAPPLPPAPLPPSLRPTGGPTTKAAKLP